MRLCLAAIILNDKPALGLYTLGGNVPGSWRKLGCLEGRNSEKSWKGRQL